MSTELFKWVLSSLVALCVHLDEMQTVWAYKARTLKGQNKWTERGNFEGRMAEGKEVASRLKEIVTTFYSRQETEVDPGIFTTNRSKTDILKDHGIVLPTAADRNAARSRQTSPSKPPAQTQAPDANAITQAVTAAVVAALNNQAITPPAKENPLNDIAIPF